MKFILLIFICSTQYLFSQNAPSAIDDNFKTVKNSTLVIEAPGILGNDSDPDGDVLELTQFSINGITFFHGQTEFFSEGSIVINSDGSLTFIPTKDFLGTIPLITYTIFDGFFTSSAVITINVINAPEPPIAVNDAKTTIINTTLEVNPPGILENDFDVNGDFLTVTKFSINGIDFLAGETAIFAEGTLTILSDGSFTFIPTTDYLGVIPQITYTISDGIFTNSAILKITVVIPPEPPVAVDDEKTILVNTTLRVFAPGVLSNDSDANNDSLIVTEFLINGVTYLAGQTANLTEGSIRISANGSYSFVPTKDFLGKVSTVTYTITDGTFTTTANLFITVFFPPTPPVANNDYDTAEINTTLNVLAPGVLANDTDKNEDVLSVTKFTVNGINYDAGNTAILTEGSITIAADGGYIFVPAPNYTGDVPPISYTITDGTFTASAILDLTVQHIDNLLEITKFSSCNQGFTSNGEYKIRYSLVLFNKSTAKDFHPTSLIKNIDIVDNLQATFGNSCVIKVDEVSVENNVFTKDYVNDIGYPREFTNNAINDGFLNINSNSIFNEDAINNLILYPRQDVTINFCVTVSPFCDGRPNPTPSGSGIDFENFIEVTSDRGNATTSLLLSDFHTTEAVLTAGLYIPEFNDDLNPPGVINFDGTYDYANRVIITNEGTATAQNFNFNMGLESFLDNRITFTEIKIIQVSGPTVNINTAYDGNTETLLLDANNSLAPGEKIILEIFYLIEPFNSPVFNFFHQLSLSQTQGSLDGFNETTAASKRRNSFVFWSDNLGDHLDRYYKTKSSSDSVSSSTICNCLTSSMRFLFTANSTTNKIISEVNKAPNNILEHEEITYKITIKNTSESVQLRNLQLRDKLTSTCGGNIINFTTPVILSSTASSNPTLNPNYNGDSDINLFLGSDGILKKDETITVQFSVTYKESCVGTNTATFTARNPLNGLVTSSKAIAVKASTDSDGDGIIDTLDLDDDNDTIPDLEEYNGLNPLDDHDNDGIPNYRDTDFGADANNDGIVDIFDFDMDGIPNHFDLDSDNDGILDIVEAGNSLSDTNRNGRTNNPVGANGLDNSKENNDSANAKISYTIPNTDNNGNPNFLDIDADDDGIVDLIEAQTTADFITLNSVFSENGIDTAFPNGIIPIDTDADGIPDYIDTNSDNDTRDDIIEGWDTNADGIPEIKPSNIDADNDGLDDAFDNNDNLVNPSNGQNPTSFPNADNTDTPERDWREIQAVKVLISNATATEGKELIFNFSVVSKNDESVLVESASAIIIKISTVNGTASSTIFEQAIAPFDFFGLSEVNFLINPFSSTSQFIVPTIKDLISEQTESFTFNATITSNNTINTEISAIGSILDDDDLPSITMNNSKENEGVSLNHTISLSNPSSTPVFISVQTFDNQAISPEDYTSFSENFTIDGTIDPNNSNTEVSFSIDSKTDNLNELDEEILDVVGTVTSNNIGLQDLNKTATIVDIDPNPLIAINDVTVEEGNILDFKIQLLNASLEPMQNYLDINLTLETIDNTTFANEDYVFVNVLKSIPAFTSSISQSIFSIDDRLNEDTETFKLQINTNLDNVSNTSLPFGTGTLIDNDYPNLFSPNGDGKSDVFEISGIVDQYPNFSITIINRQGNQVFKYHNNGSVNPIWWNGTFNGKPSPTGVYFYTLEFNDGSTKPRNNFIQLIR